MRMCLADAVEMWEEELFDKYNGERTEDEYYGEGCYRTEDDFWADVYENTHYPNDPVDDANLPFNM